MVEVHPEVDARAEVAEAVLRDAIAIDEEVLPGARPAKLRLDEPRLPDIERQVQAGREHRLVAELHLVAPLRARVVGPGARVLAVDDESEVTAFRGVHAEIEAQVIRAPAFLVREPLECRL